jgi:putative membrane protein
MDRISTLPADRDGREASSASARLAPPGRRPLPALLLASFAAIWIVLAISPHYRQDWLLENVLVLLAVPLLACSHRRLPLSDLAYAAMFAFLLLHEIGAHYTYSEVPYDAWMQRAFGVSIDAAFGFTRNHYDRALHFAYGLCAMPAAIELIEARAAPRGLWRGLLPLAFVTSHSVLYELIEWSAALVFGGELGTAYLGTQGDPWDAQRDMALALCGSVIGLGIVAALRTPGGRRVEP